MKLSRTTLIGLALAVTAVVLAAIVFNRSGPDQEAAAGGGRAGDSTAGSSASHYPPRPPGKSAARGPVDAKPLAAKELELLWARGRGQELVVELDRLSASQDPDHWQEVGPVLIKQAAKEGRPEIATYLLATGDAAPDQIRIQIYAAALDNQDKDVQDKARLELENITGEEFATGDAARAWLEANPQPVDEEEEMSEDQ